MLIILAGISISLLLGNNGIITKAKETKIQNDYASVKETCRMKVNEFYIETVSNETLEFIEFLKSEDGEKILNSDGTINIENAGMNLTTGKGTGLKDVYKIEKDENVYYVRYYDENEVMTQIDVFTLGEVKEEEKVDYFTYTFDTTTKTATVTGVKDEYAIKGIYQYSTYYTIGIKDGDEIITDVVIPEKVEEGGEVYTVTAIYNYAFAPYASPDEESLFTSFTLPDTITEIDGSTFSYCSNLISIKLPSELQSIGYMAFGYCKSLKSITIPDSVTSIGGYAFYECTRLTEITMPNRITSIESRTFYNCTELIEITIPNSVASIEEEAFSGCIGLIEITIPDSVTSIGSSAFSGCTGLTEITIPNSVTSIESFTFYSCTGLTEIIIPDSVTSIGVYTFYGCTGLTEITIPNSVTIIRSYTFYNCTGLTEITIPDSVTSIEDYAFYSCTGLTEITIPNRITSIGRYTFYNCTGLTEITIPYSVTYIGSYAFYGWISSQTINIKTYTSKPSKWSSYWNDGCEATINWAQ